MVNADGHFVDMRVHFQPGRCPSVIHVHFPSTDWTVKVVFAGVTII